MRQARHLAGVDYQALGEKLRGPFSWLDLQLHTLGMLHPTESLATKTQEIVGTWVRPALLGDFLVHTVLRVIGYTFFYEFKVVQRLTGHLTTAEMPVPDEPTN